VNSPGDCLVKRSSDTKSVILATQKLLSNVNWINNRSKDWLQDNYKYWLSSFSKDWLHNLTEDWTSSLANDQPYDPANDCRFKATNGIRKLILKMTTEAENRYSARQVAKILRTTCPTDKVAVFRAKPAADKAIEAKQAEKKEEGLFDGFLCCFGSQRKKRYI